MTKQEAIKAAQEYGITFGRDYHQECDISKSSYLAELAKRVGYRKPKNASGSTGRYFYAHLSKIKND